MRKQIKTLVLSIVGFLFMQPHALADVGRPEPLAEISIQIVNNRVLVPIVIGDYYLELALDTGASATALFQSEDLDYSDLTVRDNANIIFPALDEIVEGVRLEPEVISIGTFEYLPTRLIRVDRRPPIGDRLDLRFDGVLGQDFFGSYVVEINRHAKLMRLYEAGTDLTDYFKTTLSLVMKNTAPHIVVKSRMPWEKNVRQKELMIDTGYPGAMVIWGSKQFQQAAKGENVRNLKETNTGIFTNANFKIGPLKFLRTPVFVAPKEPQQAHKRDGLIGSNVLIWYHHVIDFPGKRLLLDTWNVDFNFMDGALYLPNDEGYMVKRYGDSDVLSSGMKTTVTFDTR
ncbi:MAG: hypothetical protein AB3N28_06195 [Kordiimonas sp.]